VGKTPGTGTYFFVIKAPSYFSDWSAMAAAGFEPPFRIPDDGLLTSLQFNTWTETLELYLRQQDPRFAAFLPPHGAYSSWEALEAGRSPEERMLRPAGGDTAEDLPLRRAELQAFLRHVADAAGTRHFSLVTRQSTSLRWIYAELRARCCQRPQQQPAAGVRLLGVVGLQYEPSSGGVGSLYAKYRDIVAASLEEEERGMGPTLEDLILVNVLGLVDSRLPAHVSDVYRQRMATDNRRLSHYRQDFKNLFISNSVPDPHGSAFNWSDSDLGGLKRAKMKREKKRS
jgi:hypothetical protein